MMMILVMMVGHAELHPLVQRATRPKIVSMAAVISPAVTQMDHTPDIPTEVTQISSDFIRFHLQGFVTSGCERVMKYRSTRPEPS